MYMSCMKTRETSERHRDCVYSHVALSVEVVNRQICHITKYYTLEG